MDESERIDLEEAADQAVSWYFQERALEREKAKPCGFVLNGYGTPRPCALDAHDPTSVHDCGGVLVVAA